MLEEGQLIPISDEQAKLGQEVLKVMGGIGGFFKDALGSVPEDLVGYLGGDWLRLRRVENIARMMERTRERLKADGVIETEPASLTLALPILRGAADESREELQDLWARLLAASLDPSRAGCVRQGFAEVISKMDPLDARVLIFFKGNYHLLNSVSPDQWSQMLGLSVDELEASLWHLEKLGLVHRGIGTSTTAFGREFLRIVSA